MQNYSLNQAVIFLIFILNGIIIGMLFDFFRVIRKICKKNNFRTYVQDVIFWILTGILVLFSIYKFNSGEIRLFVFFGIILGAIFYFLTISKCFIIINVNIFSCISKFLNKFFIGPLSFIIKLLKNACKTIYRIIDKILLKFTNKLKKTLKFVNKFKKNVAN